MDRWLSHARRSFPRGPIAVVAVAAAVLVASVLPTPGGVATRSGGVLGIDLVFHAVGYAALAAVTADAVARDRPRAIGRSVALAFAVAVAFGFGVELVQGTIAWRDFAVADAVANAVGAGLALAWWSSDRRDRLRTSTR
jgi:VanZ family protein